MQSLTEQMRQILDDIRQYLGFPTQQQTQLQPIPIKNQQDKRTLERD